MRHLMKSLGLLAGTALVAFGAVAHEDELHVDGPNPPQDPFVSSTGTWDQEYADMWALARVGLDNSAQSAWTLLKADAKPVTVAVIDTGLDWNHQDMNWSNIWRNKGEIADNGVDDDGNGYVDDMIGWDFFGRNNKPWDHDGHGTFTAGIIAADWNNDAGIAGINPLARIMVLKAINNFGHSRASYLAEAITYAVNNGARIINLSVGGPEINSVEQAAIDYASEKGVLLIVAAGNEGIDTSNYGMAASDQVITVASTGFDDKRVVFSNWGAAIDIAAPGLDVLSLRARRTDTMRDITGVEYEAGAAYVGDDNRLYRASGTSFSAPIVAGIASLMLSNDPSLSATDVKRMLLNSARDVDNPGRDQFTGHGLVDARAALQADKGLFIDAEVTGFEVDQSGGSVSLVVQGTADADQFKSAVVEYGAGENPSRWQKADTLRKPVKAGVLARIPADKLRDAPLWIVRVVVTHKNGTTRESWLRLELG